jgi:peroxiredoxin
MRDYPGSEATYWEIILLKKTDNNPQHADSLSYIIGKETHLPVRIYQSLYNASVDNRTIRIVDSILINTREQTDIAVELAKLIHAGYNVENYQAPVEEDFFEKADSLTVAPGFTVTDQENKPVALKEVNTKLVLFDFSYLGCLPCLQSIPALNNIFLKYKQKGLSLFWIDPVDHRDLGFSLEQFKKQKINFPVYYDKDRSVTNLYGIQNFPHLFLVEMPSGKIIYKSKGFSEKMEDEVIKTIESYLK